MAVAAITNRMPHTIPFASLLVFIPLVVTAWINFRTTDLLGKRSEQMKSAANR